MRKALNFLLVFLTLIVTLLNLAGTIKGSLYYTLDDLPKGEFLFSSLSNDLSKTLKVYRVEIATLGKGCRAEIISTVNGKETTKNIYWHVGKDNAIVSWINNDVVLINDVEINVLTETYDSRRVITIPEVSAKNKGLS